LLSSPEKKLAVDAVDDLCASAADATAESNAAAELLPGITNEPSDVLLSSSEKKLAVDAVGDPCAFAAVATATSNAAAYESDTPAMVAMNAVVVILWWLAVGLKIAEGCVPALDCEMTSSSTEVTAIVPR